MLGFEGDVSPDASHGMVEDRAVLLHDNTYYGSDRPGKFMDGDGVCFSALIDIYKPVAFVWIVCTLSTSCTDHVGPSAARIRSLSASLLSVNRGGCTEWT